MPTAFNALSQALAARLLEAPQIVADRVDRSRTAPIPREWPSAIVVRTVSTAGQRNNVGSSSPIDWQTEYAIEIYARATADQIAEDVLDPLLAAVFDRLAGWVPPGLATFEVLPEPRIDWDVTDGQTPLVFASLRAQITHRTQAASLASWG